MLNEHWNIHCVCCGQFIPEDDVENDYFDVGWYIAVQVGGAKGYKVI